LEKRGLADALKAAGIQQGDQVVEADEMRLGLQGKVRRVWSCKGVKIVQRLQFVFEWVYLVLSVDPLTGKLHWDWMTSMKQVDLKPVVAQWHVDAVIWDRAASHRGSEIGELDFKRIFQPPYSPELNPVERIFESLRQAVEGKMYPSLAAKKRAVEAELRRLAAQPNKVKQLAGWQWLCDALQSLPDP